MAILYTCHTKGFVLQRSLLFPWWWLFNRYQHTSTFCLPQPHKGRNLLCQFLHWLWCIQRHSPSSLPCSPCYHSRQSSQPAAAHSGTPAFLSSWSFDPPVSQSKRGRKEFKNQNDSWINGRTSEVVHTALKAQQEPHCFWSLTSVTYPLSLQSTLVGRSLTSGNRKKAEPWRGWEALKEPRQPLEIRCLYSWFSWQDEGANFNVSIHHVILICILTSW